MHDSFGDAAEHEATDIAKPPTSNEDDVSIDLLRALANLVDNTTRQNPRLDPYSSSTISIHSTISTVWFDRETIFWKVLENQFSMKTCKPILFLDDIELLHRVRTDHTKNN